MLVYMIPNRLGHSNFSWSILVNYGTIWFMFVLHHALLALHTYMPVLLLYTMGQISYYVTAHVTQQTLVPCDVKALWPTALMLCECFDITQC